jgi:hypothetical protein
MFVTMMVKVLYLRWVLLTDLGSKFEELALLWASGHRIYLYWKIFPFFILEAQSGIEPKHIRYKYNI